MPTCTPAESENHMATGRAAALKEFKRMMVWIGVAGVAMVVLALWYLSLYGPLNIHMVIATTLGVFISTMLGCGLFAAAFFSDKSGHDQASADATVHQDEPRD